MTTASATTTGVAHWNDANDEGGESPDENTDDESGGTADEQQRRPNIADGKHHHVCTCTSEEVRTNFVRRQR